jgi:major type 1 subunit fimbrin (pilin)
MKTQFRIMATIVGILVSGAVVAPSQPARSTLSVNPGTSAGAKHRWPDRILRFDYRYFLRY